MKLPTLYKRDENGNVRTWTIEMVAGSYRTISGVEGGKQVTSKWTVCEPKNIGRLNETTINEQAFIQAKSIHKKKSEKDYHANLDTIDTAIIYKPMLAAKWPDYKDKVSYPVFIQPKLDGIRCIAKRDGLWTRAGKPIVSVPHIFESLQPLFMQQPDLVLDGELYNHELKHDFNEIISLTRKTKPTEDDLVQSKEYIQYHVYDIPSSKDVYEHRLEELRKTCGQVDYVHVVRTVICQKEGVNNLHDCFLEEGYEGSIIRLNKPYEQKRSKSLLKYKVFDDEEFTIVRIEEGQGNWAGFAKRVIFKNDGGKEVGGGIAGTQGFCKELLDTAEQYIGGQVTIQYCGRTPDNVPRFPVAKAFYKTKRDS